MSVKSLICEKTGLPGGTGKSFAEFFAGIGLVGAGLESGGWKCVYANDVDPKKREIYVRNFDDSDVYDERDLREIEAVAGRITHQPFLATASFPCIDLSLAGHWRGFHGTHSSIFFAFMEVLEALRSRAPRLLMIENVPGLLTCNGGNDFRRVCQEIANHGYWVDAFVLDAKSFVPQSRPRVFIIGVHESLELNLLEKQTKLEFGDPWLGTINKYPSIRPRGLVRLMRATTLPKTGWAVTPIRPPKQRSYRLSMYLDADDGQAWWSREDTEKHFSMLSDLHRLIVERHMNSGNELIGTGYRRKRNGSTKLEVRFDGVAGCLRTPRGGSARQIVVHIKDGKFRLRWMSAREYARLQGADEFTLVENERQMLFGFGDAVCVPVIAWVDECVLSPIYKAAVIQE